VRGARAADDQVIAELDGTLERFTVMAVPGAVLVAHRGAAHRFELGLRPQHQLTADDNVVIAPLPGILVAVNVTPGDSVGPGQVLGVLESMKMEYPLTARAPAQVQRVGFNIGSRVDRGDVLFELVAGQE
jgi:biotin carboxyl carrier protein